MPTAAQSRAVDMSRLKRIEPVAPVKPTHPMPPLMPAHLTGSTVFITSLPALATKVDGITRQFYNTPNLPTRRVILP